MAVIALSFWARDLTGTFAWSGALVGCYTATTAFVGPMLGRAADRFGARRVLVPVGICHAAGFVVIAVLPASVWWLGLGVAALTGAVLPPVSATVRAAWPRMVGGARLRLAFTLEATVQELMFAMGPLVAALLVSFAGSRIAVAGCGVVAVAGTLWFASRPALRADGATVAGGALVVERESVLRHPARAGLIAGMALFVGAFSANQLGIVAFAEHAGERALSGVLEMVWSLGSFAGGITAGLFAMRRRAVPWRRVALVAVGFVACVLAVDVWWLAATLALAGAMIAPSMAAIYERMGELAPAGARTESFAWMSTAGMAGAGVGAVFAGRLVEVYGPAAGFGLAAGMTVLAACALLPAKRTGEPESLPAPHPAPI